jgi:peptidoglycan/LPS O-acetylase OafA/YrhL
MHGTLINSRSASPHIHSIDLLRAYAALYVCLVHLTDWGSFIDNPQLRAFVSWGGLDGVCLFFIVSGFVIPFALFNGSYQLRAFPRFMAKRIVRLEPPYIASLVLAAALWWRFQYSASWPLDITPGTAALHLGYLIDIARSFGATANWYNGIYWTLAYELQYYVFLALLFPLIASRVTSVRVGFAVLLTATKYALMAAPAPLFLNYAEFFAFGIVLFQRRVGLSTPVECAVLTLLLVGCMAMESWRFAVYGPLVVGVVISRGINWAPARMLGPISYSLYLTHYSFGMWFRDALANKLTLGALYAAILALIASVCFAALFYWLIERPSLRLSKRISYARCSAGEGLRYSSALWVPSFRHQEALETENTWAAFFQKISAQIVSSQPGLARKARDKCP